MGEIILLGDRRNTGFCLKCGTDLVIPWNDYQCCTECTKFLAHHKKLAESRTEPSKRVKKNIIPRYNIALQRKPIGGIPRDEL